MNALGTQILLELKGCAPHLLDDLEFVKHTLVNVANEVGVTVIGESFHKFDPQGVTGILAIAESHISIHTWPEHGFAALDVFTCGDPEQARRASELLIVRFRCSGHTSTELSRGPLSETVSALETQD